MVHRRKIRRLAWSAAALLIVSLLIMNTAELRTLAQEVIDLFVQTESDEQEVTIITDPPQGGEPYYLLGGARATYEEAQTFVDFMLPEPDVPAPYELNRFHLTDRWVQARYYTPSTRQDDFPRDILFIHFVDIAQLTPEELADNEVGASAEIMPIDLGHGVTAEYVAGAWVNPTTGDLGAGEYSARTKTSITYQYVWSNDYPAFAFRWEYEGIMYALFGYDVELDQADLTAIAISMMDQLAP